MTDRVNHRIRLGACLSLSGRYARFGTQAARALDVWRSLDGRVDLVIEDDRSDPQTLGPGLCRVAAGVDVLLSPYFTQRVLSDKGIELWIAHGKGSFGRQVAEGAYRVAQHAGIRTRRLMHGDTWPPSTPSESWTLLSAGTFEQDVATVRRARNLSNPP